MLRRFIASMTLALALLVGVSSTAVAAPLYGQPTISVTHLGFGQLRIVISNFGSSNDFDLRIVFRINLFRNAVSFGGFGLGGPPSQSPSPFGQNGFTFGQPGAGFGQSGVNFFAPSGLRAPAAVISASAAAATEYTVDLDADGNGEAVIDLGDAVSAEEAAAAAITAEGYPSGNTVSAALDLTDGATVEAAAAVDSSSSATDSGYVAAGYDSASLTNSGTNIAGPISIGIATLIAGLGLLFFGTRGVIRRRGARTTTG